MSIITLKELKAKSNKELLNDFECTIIRHTHEVNDRGRVTKASLTNFERLEAEIEERMSGNALLKIITNEYYHHKNKVDLLTRRINRRMAEEGADVDRSVIDRLRDEKVRHETRMVSIRYSLSELGIDLDKAI